MVSPGLFRFKDDWMTQVFNPETSKYRGSMRHLYQQPRPHNPNGLTTFTGVLAVISTIIGGGIVAIPYSFVSFGIPLAVLINIVAVALVTGSVVIYLRVKDIIPDHPESLYEIGYLVIGRSAIFIVALIQFILSFGLILVYFIVFGDTAGQLLANVFNNGDTSGWQFQRSFYVALLGLLMTPVILKKELAELEWLSWVLFGSLSLFVVLLLWMLMIDETFVLQAHGLTGETWIPDHGGSRLISALSITLVAYGYQQNIYPIFGSLKFKTNEQYLTVNKQGLALTMAIYTSVAILTIAMFGDDISAVLLTDIGTAETPNGFAYWESYFIQIAFMILLACHMPFIYFAGKEGVLIIVDETARESISNALWHKLYATGSQFEIENIDALPPAPQLPAPGESQPFLLQDQLQNTDSENVRTSRADTLATLKTRLSMISAYQSNRLAYKEMRCVYYYGVSILCWLLILVLSCVVQDVTVIFDLTSTFAISALQFVIPAVFYWRATAKYGDISTKINFACYFYFSLGVLNFVLGCVSTGLNIKNGAVQGH